MNPFVHILGLFINNELNIMSFDPAASKFELLHKEKYPYGETAFNTGNSAFYLNGQFGDALLSITKVKTASDGSLWISDFLSGKIFVLEKQ